MNGMQVTGTVHAARVTINTAHSATTQVLTPRCQRLGSATRCYLGATDQPVTCKRCIAKLAKAVA